MNPWCTRLLAAAMGLLAPRVGLGAAANPIAFAIVIGNNHSPSPDIGNLRYADDDAIASARTFALLGAKTTLLVSPDAETLELSPNDHPDGPATRQVVTGAFDRIYDQVRAAHAGGSNTVLYVVFAGHGDFDEDRPYLQLEDGRLWREDLIALLQKSPGGPVHVVLDACQASLFVGGRGAGGTKFRVGAGFSKAASGAWPRDAGILTARSSGGQTHEWAEFQAGIFSHEVRSGLSGAADADGNGRITYRELAAFVERANAAISNRKYRPQVIVSPPNGDADMDLVALPTGPLVLDIDPALSGRTFVETERGVRLVDLNSAPGQRVSLILPTDRGTLFIERASPAAEFRVVPRPGRIALADVPAEIPRNRSRGAAHEAFRQLFSLPFDKSAVANFKIDGAEIVIDETGASFDHTRPGLLRRAAPWVVLTLGLAGVAAGIWAAVDANHLEKVASGESGTRRVELGAAIDNRNRQARTWAGTGGIVAGLAGAFLVWNTRF